MAASIRPLERLDLSELVDLCREHAAYERSAWSESSAREAGLAAQFLDPGGATCWVVEGGAGGLLGFASANLELSTWDAARYMHLDCIYLREAARRQGLGRQLMERVAAAALAAGAVNLQWQTPAWNADAVRFYRRLGAASKDKLRFTLDPQACARLTAPGTAPDALAEDRPGTPAGDGAPAPASRWEPRTVTPLPLERSGAWRVKPYGLNLPSGPQAAETERMLSSARDLVATELAAIDAAGTPHPALAVVILHRGADCWWLVLDAWLEGGTLSHQIFGAPFLGPAAAPGWERGERRSPSICVWELAVLCFEREAYVRHLFAAGEAPEEEAYLAARMTGTC